MRFIYYSVFRAEKKIDLDGMQFFHFFQKPDEETCFFVFWKKTKKVSNKVNIYTHMVETVVKAEEKRVTPAEFFATEDFGKWALTLEGLFQSGAHYGHKKSRRNPMMEEYVYTYRGDLALIDLKKTKDRLEEALEFIASIAKDKKTLLFVGTKKHAQALIRAAAERCESPYVTERWLGGTFTNFEVIRKRVKYMEEVEQKIASGDLKHYTKFEQSKKMDEAEKLERRMGGLRKLKELPAAILVADVKNDMIAIREAKRAGVPVIALVDTNDSPLDIDYVIPANNDALSSLKYILGQVCRVYLEAGVVTVEKEIK